MARTTGFLLLAILAISYVAVEAATPKSVCNKLTAVATNGKKRTVNLDELAQASTIKPFSVVDQVGQWTYEFGICVNVPCGQSTGAACQETTQPSFYPLGTYPAQPVAVYNTGFAKGAIQFDITPAGDPPRGSVITVICDPKAKTAANFSVISAPLGSQPPYIYQIFMSHKSACSGGGLSGGSILLITLTVLFVVYFLGGFIFLKFVRGNEGVKECIPNYEFWSDLPSLCKDGLMFIINKIRGGGSGGYETVA